MTSTPPSVHSLGDSAVTLTFGTERSRQLLEHVHAMARALEAARIPHVEDIVPAYLGLTVFYDALRVSCDEIAKTLLDACTRSTGARTEPAQPQNHRIPVRYDGDDLDAVAAALGLSRSEVITLHAERIYSVDLLGFVPGFAYLSELHPSLQVPRRPEPRPRVPAGSVAIAASHTGVYPLDTPGGWHIIGHTMTVMFDPHRDPPALLRAGDTVTFEHAS